MNAPASSLLLPEDNDTTPPAFHRLLYHYIRAVQQQHPLDNPFLLQPLIDQVDQAIQQTLPKNNPGPSPVPV